MNKPFLTIGMPTYDDFHGIYFSVQALRMYHPEIMDKTEIIIVDNNPNSAHGKETKHFSNSAPYIKYVPYEESVGPANAKNRVFEEAQGSYVLCMDGHIFFEPGALGKLIDMYKQIPDTSNLYQAPLVYDDLNNISTHFDPVWRGQMYGIWATDERGRDKNAEPFEIEMTGCGVLSCRKEAWLGFNKSFRGFGGEEGYIQEKFRQAGHTTMCLPFLRWVHRFGRPDGVKYPLTMENKLRNFFIGHFELGLDITPIIDHFKEWKTKEQLLQMAAVAKKEMMDLGYFK